MRLRVEIKCVWRTGVPLLQVVLQAQIASEQEVSASQVQGITQKLIRRHPHVLGNVKFRVLMRYAKIGNKIQSSRERGILLTWLSLNQIMLVHFTGRPGRKFLKRSCCWVWVGKYCSVWAKFDESWQNSIRRSAYESRLYNKPRTGTFCR